MQVWAQHPDALGKGPPIDRLISIGVKIVPCHSSTLSLPLYPENHTVSQ
jgi:hypothetical protein